MKNIFLFLTFIVFIGCANSPTERQYTEIVIDPVIKNSTTNPNNPHEFLQNPASMDMSAMPDSMNKILEDSVAEIDLSWTVPQGWIEQPGQGMRVATFITQDADPIECSIVSLGGIAGGIQSNLTRWLGQLEITDIAPKTLQVFIQNSETLTSVGQYNIQIFDLSQLQNNVPDTTKSMIAAMIENKQQTIFIKMIGTKSAVQKQFEAFKQLNQSLK